MEIIAVIFSLLSVLLAIKIKVLNWPVGIIGILAYMVVFYNNHLYAQAALQIIFIGQSIYGWYYWNKNKTKHPSFIITPLRLLFDLLIVWVLTLILAICLKKHTNDPQPAFDAITTTLSILATWYMTKKCNYSWLIWIIVDIFFIFMFMFQEMYWSAGLYFIFMLLSIKGLLQWTKNTTTA